MLSILALSDVTRSLVDVCPFKGNILLGSECLK